MKHHAERLRYLQQLEADLDRQIADAQQLHRDQRLGRLGAPMPEQPSTKRSRTPQIPGSRRARKRR